MSRSDPPLLIGVSREQTFSPGRFLEADRSILHETARACEAGGARVRILPPDAPREAFTGAALVFTMCQGPESLETMRWLAASRVTVINQPSAIQACYRTRMLPLLSRAALPRPEAREVACADPAPEALRWAEERGEAGVWVKRGDVHATRSEDVVHVRGEASVRAAESLGLTVYGGDLVVGEGEEALLVDVNDWPSFSRCRVEAAAAIADHLFRHLDRSR